ncbi:MAG TPA: hypothetical protein VGK94_07375 [Candidatus Polarisedimenticolia bacterium]
MLAYLIAAFLATTAPPPIDPNHLALTDCPGEPGCPALVLLYDVELDNAPDHPRVSRRRIIKVFTQEGIDRYTDLEINEPAADMDVMNLAGRTILPDGRVIPLAPENILLKSGMGEEGEPIRRRSAKFSGVVPGATIELSYDAFWRQITTISEFVWDLQWSIPILEGRMRLRQGQWRMQWSQSGLEEVPVTHTTPSRNLEEFTVSSVPSVPFEPLSPPPEALRARLFFYIPVTQADWLGQVAGRLAGRTGAFIERSPAVAAKVGALAPATEPPLERVRKIYGFVQEEIGTEQKRLGETASRKVAEARNAADVLARGYGDDLERTLLFVAMVKEAGLEPALLNVVERTASGFDQSTPDESQLNAFAAAVKIGDGWTFYDVAVRYCPFAMIAPEKESDVPNAILLRPEKGQGFKREVHLSGRVGTVYDPAPYFVVTIPVSRSGRNVLTREARVTLSVDGGARVEVSDQGTGLAGLDIRREFAGLDEDGRKEAIASRVREIDPTAKPGDFSSEELESFDKPATVRYTLSLTDLASRVGDRLIVPVSMLNLGRPNPFAPAARRAPVSFPHTQKTREKVIIEVPAGCVPEELPERTLIKEGPLTLATFFSREMGAVVFNRHLEVNTISWPAADYARLRAFFEKVREADRQVIVFRKSTVP